MTTLKATQKLIRLTTRASGALHLDFTVEISPKGLVSVNGQPVGYSEGDLGWVSAYEHFALQMTELRKAERKREREKARTAS